MDQRAPRRAEVLAALSLAIDLGLGQPMEHMLRSGIIAARLAERLGLDEQQRGTVFYANLVAWIGCHADSHELARWFGDDIAFRADTYEVDWRGLPFLRMLASHVGQGRGPVDRGRAAAAFFVNARGRLAELIHSHCTSAACLSDRLGLGEPVRAALVAAFERWDGSGLPAGLHGEQIPIEMRVVHLAEVAEVHWRHGGVEAAMAMAKERSATQFDPQVVAAFSGTLVDFEDDVWTTALRQAPDNDQVLGEDELDELLAAIGDFVDLKCPFTIGHSRGVAALAAAAAHGRGLSDSDVRLVRRAALVHDLGRMGVPNTLWEKPGPLGRRVGAGAAAPVPDRADPAPGARARPGGRDRGGAPRAVGRFGLPARRRGCVAGTAGPPAGRRGHVPRAGGRPSAPTRL
ncbi:HD domain-containing protein [Labedaea rhizosphaerae]|uniref:HD domain-containing protein n=1 Tax=Labedaea rhizosphaerae TaxID=598644 RepID=A0A4R6S7Z2_LABRH|nr:HD domain-containing protein [Labedaea rhizosphaerae]